MSGAEPGDDQQGKLGTSIARRTTKPMVRCQELGCSSCTACAAAGESASDTSEEHRKKRPKHLDIYEYSQGLYHMVRAAAAFVIARVPPVRSR